MVERNRFGVSVGEGSQLARTSQEERQHQDQLKQLNEKVEYYQDIIQRQEAELKNYQVKYGPVAPPANVDEALDAKLPQWISDPHYLSPLLTAVSKF